MVRYPELSKNIRRGVILPVYLFWGEESFLVREALALLRAAVAVSETDFNYQVLRAGETSLVEIVNLANTLPVLARRRMLVVKEAPWFKSAARGSKNPSVASETKKQGKGEEETLLAYLEAPCPTTCLVFVAEDQINTQKKLTKAILKHGDVIEFSFLKGVALTNWIKQRVVAVGKEITPEGLAYLAINAGPNLSRLQQELEKLSLYLGPETTITFEMVCLLTSRAHEASIFELVDALGEKKRDKALVLLHEMLAAGKPPLWLAHMITRQFRLIFQMKVLQGEGKSEPASLLKLPPFVMRKLKKQAAVFEPAELEQIMHKLRTLDLQLKSSALEPGWLLERLLWGLCG
jgi:DNA polymerase-3 subunit delta